MTAAPFESLAAEYDAAFTNSVLGRLFRDAVWRRLNERFAAGDRVLELNCGTGEDALYLARRGIRVTATDVASTMLEETRKKASAGGVEALVTICSLDLNALARGMLPACVEAAQPFDGMLSNFGGLNCVDDLRGLGRAVAALLRPEALVVICVMGPVVPWEWLWYLWRRKPGKAFRRLAPGGVRWKGLHLRYPSIRFARRAFSPSFRVLRVAALGALMPPPYAESWAIRHPTLLRVLHRVERRFERMPPLPRLADHYLMELVRV